MHLRRTNWGEMRPAVVSGIVIGDALVSYWPIFSPSLVTVPEVFANVNSAQFLLVSKVANGQKVKGNHHFTYNKLTLN